MCQSLFFNLIEVEVNVKLANLESGKKEEIEEKVEIQRNRFLKIFSPWNNLQMTSWTWKLEFKVSFEVQEVIWKYFHGIGWGFKGK